MNDLLERARCLPAWVDALSLRERLLVFAAVLVCVVVVWDGLLMSPVQAARARVQEELEEEERRIVALGAELATLQAAARNDPNRRNREETARLQTRLRALDQQLAERTSDLIPPSEMPHVLKDLLRRHTGVSLVRLEALPVEQLAPVGRSRSAQSSQGDAGSQRERDSVVGASLYKHGLSMTLRGDYPSTLRYLEAVEKLRWQLLWDRLAYRVTEYPEASVELVVYSLSTEEEWIGV